MKYSFHPEAEIEFNISIDYYEECQINLGLEFANEVYTTIQRILAYPNAWQPLGNEIRRCLTNRFPFGAIKMFSGCQGRYGMLKILTSL